MDISTPGKFWSQEAYFNYGIAFFLPATEIAIHQIPTPVHH